MSFDYSLFDTLPHSVDAVEIKGDCLHPASIVENGVMLCMDCGNEMTRIVSTDKDLRYYGLNDARHNTDPTRVQARKNDERTIFKDVEAMQFGDTIVSLANKLYGDITAGQIKRGKSRKGLIFACIYMAYKMAGKPRPPEALIPAFSISKKDGLKGIQEISLKVSKDQKLFMTSITPVHLIEEIMSEFDVRPEHIKEVLVLYSKIENKSSKINRARPQSTASGVVWYWICKNGKNINLKDFAHKIGLSELTITKISSIVADIIEK